MSYTITQLKTKLSTVLRDTNDSKWTSAEKDEALAEAFEDPSLCYYAEDTSLTASTSTQAYSVPAGVEKVVDIWITPSGATTAYRCDPQIWEQRYGKIIFSTFPPYAGTMSLTVIKKYTTADTLPAEMGNFVLFAGAIACYEMLQNKFVSGINDVSMSEIQLGLAYFEKKLRDERAKLGRNANRTGYKI